MAKKDTSKTSARTGSHVDHAGRGHPKLTAEQREDAIRRAGTGETQRSIARSFGVSDAAIGRVLRRAEAEGRSVGHRRREDHRGPARGAAVGPAPGVPSLPEADGDPRARLVELIGQTRELREDARERRDTLAYTRLSTLEADHGRRIAELDRMMHVEDPRNDPACREARDLVVRLLRLTLEGGADVVPPERDGA